MKKAGVTCSDCGAGFERIELSFEHATKGDYRCPSCGSVLEKLDGCTFVAYRLTVQPYIKGLRD